MPDSALTEHIVLVSVDALFSQDYETLKTLPNFRKFFFKGTVIKQVKSIFPTLTYPIHTTILTGVKPAQHGIINNIKFQPGEVLPEWNWYYDYIKTPTIIDLLYENKMTIGSLLWPVTAKTKKIKYNIPEIWPVRGENQILLSLKTGSPFFILKNYFKYSNMLDGIKQPNLDDFTIAVAADMIRNKKPNLSLIHLLELDVVRHRKGTFSKEAMESLRNIDIRIGKIIEAIQNAGMYEKTTIILMGDHGFVDINTRLSLNSIFRNAGLMKTDETGALTDWEVYANYFAGGAYIYLKDKDNTHLIEKVYNILIDLKDKNILKNIWLKDNFSDIEISGNFDFVVEANPGYYIINDWLLEPPIHTIDKFENNYEDYIAIHGYGPDINEYNTILLAKGQGIKQNNELSLINITDIAPTLAHLFGLKFLNTNGKIIFDMID